MIHNLIRFTTCSDYRYLIDLQMKLGKKGIKLKSEYRGYNLERKAQMNNIIHNEFENKIENLKSIIKEKNLQPKE